MTEGGERANHFRDHGCVDVLIGPNLLEIDAGSEEDPRRDELQGVVAAYARAQRALHVIKGLQWWLLALGKRGRSRRECRRMSIRTL